MLRNHRFSLAAIVGVASLGLCGPAALAQPGAQSPPTPPLPEAEDPLYRIELIVFRYDAGNPGEEDLAHGSLPADAPHRLQVPGIRLETVFGDAEDAEAEDPLDSDAPDGQERANDTLELIEPAYGERGSDGVAGAAAARLPPDFQRLGQAELELTGARARLENIDAYTVLAHTGWVQSGVEAPTAPWLDLRYLGLSNPTGSVRVRRGRFFFVALDLTMHDEHAVTYDPGAVGLSPLTRGRSYHLEVERSAIREGQLHYFDHPLFGVLVLVTPVADEDADELPAA